MADSQNYKPKISVIITAHNYAKYLGQAIDSVLNQTLDDFELIIVDDGSTDFTQEVLAKYKGSPKINVIKLEGVGLAKACNLGIRESRGEYIIRLDADDYFDENMLLVESCVLDTKSDVHLVFCDYYRIDSTGDLIDYYRLMGQDESTLLDRSSLASGIMFRRWCYEEVGGYNEGLKYQEDYDFWLKFTSRFKVYKVHLPLYYYRKHDGTMSTQTQPRMEARRQVKSELAKRRRESYPEVIGVIPASTYLMKGVEYKPPLININDEPLIHFAIQNLQSCQFIQKVFVSADDPEVERVALENGALSLGLRPKRLSKPATMEEIVKDTLSRLSESRESIPEVVATLGPDYPLVRSVHLDEAIDTLVLHDYDSVVSVTEEDAFHWHPGPAGFVPIGYHRGMMKMDKEKVYKETGGIRVVQTKNLLGHSWLGHSIGYIELAPRDALRIEDPDWSRIAVEAVMGMQVGQGKDMLTKWG